MISVRRTKGLPTASFRFHLTMDTLAVQLYTSSLPRRVRDFHPLERAHGAQTEEKVENIDNRLEEVESRVGKIDDKLEVVEGRVGKLYTSSLPRRVRDFHPLERAHGAQTKRHHAINA